MQYQTMTGSTAELAGLIEEKLRLLEEIRQLGYQQWQWITSDEMEKLLNVLAAKESLVRRLHEVERRLDPFRHQDPESRLWSSPHHRARCRQMAEQCEAVLAEIVFWEKQGEQELLRRRDEAAARLQALESQTLACRSYLPQNGPAACGQQLDLASEG